MGKSVNLHMQSPPSPEAHISIWTCIHCLGSQETRKLVHYARREAVLTELTQLTNDDNLGVHFVFRFQSLKLVDELWELRVSSGGINAHSCRQHGQGLTRARSSRLLIRDPVRDFLIGIKETGAESK